MHIIDGAYIRFAKVQLKLMKKKKRDFFTNICYFDTKINGEVCFHALILHM